MGIPILTTEGFVGQRLIVNDYFRAGETIRAGDVLGIRQDPDQGNHPGVFRVSAGAGGTKSRRIIGIAHTPLGMEVGDVVAEIVDSEGEYVPVVVQGVAHAMSAEAMGVGDAVAPSLDSVARVKAAEAGDPILGRCLTVTPDAGQVIEVMVDLVGGGIPRPPGPVHDLGLVPAGEREARLREWGDDQGSVNQSGRYARFYSFSLDHDATVTIDLASVEDSYLYLLHGQGVDGAVIAQDNNSGSGTNARSACLSWKGRTPLRPRPPGRQPWASSRSPAPMNYRRPETSRWPWAMFSATLAWMPPGTLRRRCLLAQSTSSCIGRLRLGTRPATERISPPPLLRLPSPASSPTPATRSGWRSGTWPRTVSSVQPICFGVNSRPTFLQPTERDQGVGLIYPRPHRGLVVYAFRVRYGHRRISLAVQAVFGLDVGQRHLDFYVPHPQRTIPGRNLRCRGKGALPGR